MNCWKKNKKNIPGRYTAVWMSIIGILLMVLGLLRGEIGTVFLKATKICLECIGIG